MTGISIGFWIKCAGQTTNYNCINFIDANNNGIVLNRYAGWNAWWLRLGVNTQIIKDFPTSIDPDYGEWRAYMLTVDYVDGVNSVFTFYVNGVFICTVTHAYPTITRTTQAIICDRPYNGWIGSLYVFEKCLSLAQVVYVFNKDSKLYLGNAQPA